MVCRYQNGAEQVEFDESMLTEIQKMAIELGDATLDDFRPRSNVYGNRVTLYKLVKFNLTGDYADGVQEVMTTSELEDCTYMPPQEENADDVLKGAMNAPVVDDDDDDEDLFG